MDARTIDADRGVNEVYGQANDMANRRGSADYLLNRKAGSRGGGAGGGGSAMDI